MFAEPVGELIVLHGPERRWTDLALITNENPLDEFAASDADFKADSNG